MFSLNEAVEEIDDVDEQQGDSEKMEIEGKEDAAEEKGRIQDDETGIGEIGDLVEIDGEGFDHGVGVFKSGETGRELMEVSFSGSRVGDDSSRSYSVECEIGEVNWFVGSTSEVALCGR